MRGCHKISLLGISKLLTVRSPCHTSLVELDIGNVPKAVNDKTLKLLAECPCAATLQRLCLKGSIHVTDTGIKILLISCKTLTSLDISGCTSLTDNTLKTIAAQNTRLTSLDISGTPITATGLHNLDDMVRSRGLHIVNINSGNSSSNTSQSLQPPPAPLANTRATMSILPTSATSALSSSAALRNQLETNLAKPAVQVIRMLSFLNLGSEYLTIFLFAGKSTIYFGIARLKVQQKSKSSHDQKLAIVFLLSERELPGRIKNLFYWSF